MIRSILGYALLISGCTLVAFWWGLTHSLHSPLHATTLAFMTLAFAQIFHLGNARSATPVLARARVVSNRFAVLAVVITSGMQALAISLPPLAHTLRLSPLRLEDWMVVLGLAAIPAVVGQGIKALGSGNRRLLI